MKKRMVLSNIHPLWLFPDFQPNNYPFFVPTDKGEKQKFTAGVVRIRCGLVLRSCAFKSNLPNLDAHTFRVGNLGHIDIYDVPKVMYIYIHYFALHCFIYIPTAGCPCSIWSYANANIKRSVRFTSWFVCLRMLVQSTTSYSIMDWNEKFSRT